MFPYKIPQAKVKVEWKDYAAPSERYKIKNSLDMWYAAKAIFDSDTIEWKEEVLMFCIQNNNAVVNYYKVASGGVSNAGVDPKIVFTIALQSNATGIILAHNHPSGRNKASSNDIELTNRLIEGGKILGIRVVDHLIVTSEGYYSMADEGVIKTP